MCSYDAVSAASGFGVTMLSLRRGRLRLTVHAVVMCVPQGVLVRVTGDTIALSPPLIIEKQQIDQIMQTIQEALNETD